MRPANKHPRRLMPGRLLQSILLLHGALLVACQQPEQSAPARSSATATVPRAPQAIPTQPKAAASTLYPEAELRVVEDYEPDAERQINKQNYQASLERIERALSQGAGTEQKPAASASAKPAASTAAPSASTSKPSP